MKNPLLDVYIPYSKVIVIIIVTHFQMRAKELVREQKRKLKEQKEQEVHVHVIDVFDQEKADSGEETEIDEEAANRNPEDEETIDFDEILSENEQKVCIYMKVCGH